MPNRIIISAAYVLALSLAACSSARLGSTSNTSDRIEKPVSNVNTMCEATGKKRDC